MTAITQESDPTTWARLYALWLEEKRPGWVTTGTKTYMVIQQTDGSYRFELQSGEGLYESTSFTA